MSGFFDNQQVLPTAVFNPGGDDNTRKVWFGNTTNLMQLSDIRYPWAIALYEQMRENFWIPESIDLTQDVITYPQLSPDEYRSYNGMLSYLTFLDSLQTCYLPYIKMPLTAPEVSLCLAEQISQEAMHNKSYQVMIDAIIPAEHRAGIYDFWRTDKVLFDRCQSVAGLYQNFLDLPTWENYFYSCIADYLLEGLYFYNGFIFFYNLAHRSLMSASADVFKLINRDELSHVRLHRSIILEAMQVFRFDKSRIYEMFDTAVSHEIAWTNHITNGNILGISPDSTDIYTKYLANIRLKAIGLDPLYVDGNKYLSSPYRHLERFADTKDEGNTKSNFFESRVTSYQIKNVKGWDDLK